MEATQTKKLLRNNNMRISEEKYTFVSTFYSNPTFQQII